MATNKICDISTPEKDLRNNGLILIKMTDGRIICLDRQDLLHIWRTNTIWGDCRDKNGYLIFDRDIPDSEIEKSCQKYYPVSNDFYISEQYKREIEFNNAVIWLLGETGELTYIGTYVPEDSTPIKVGFMYPEKGLRMNKFQPEFPSKFKILSSESVQDPLTSMESEPQISRKSISAISGSLPKPDVSQEIILKTPREIIFKAPNIQPCNIKGFLNRDNSCFIDSVLLALFAIPNRYTDYILSGDSIKPDVSLIGKSPHDTKIIRGLTLMSTNNAVKSLRGEISDSGEDICVEIRSFLSSHFPISISSKTSQEDPDEFLKLYFDILGFYIAKQTTKREYYIGDGMRKTTNTYPTTPILDISSSPEDIILSKMLDYTAKDFIDDEYNYIITRYIFESPYIIFNTVNTYSNSGKVIMEEYFTHKTDMYFLTSIVAYVEPRHYICFILCSYVWYLYDDLSPTLRYIGVFEELDAYISRNSKIKPVQYYYISV